VSHPTHQLKDNAWAIQRFNFSVMDQPS